MDEREERRNNERITRGRTRLVSTISLRFNWRAIYNKKNTRRENCRNSSPPSKGREGGRNYRDRQLSLYPKSSRTIGLGQFSLLPPTNSSQSRRSLSAAKYDTIVFNARALLRCYFRGGRPEENRPERGTNREEGKGETVKCEREKGDLARSSVGGETERRSLLINRDALTSSALFSRTARTGRGNERPPLFVVGG